MKTPLTTLRLPCPDGTYEQHAMTEPVHWPRPDRPIGCRAAYAAAHVVANPLADNTPGAPAAVDWDATLAFRRHVWDYGLGVADAMDTAQRGMGLDWPATSELIRRSAAEARSCGGLLGCGAGTDHAPANPRTLDDVIAAYEEQVAVVEEAGAQVVLMASRQLVRVARDAEDYAKVYGRLLEQLSEPAILHWLGPMFDPQLSGYWGSSDIAEATESLLAITRAHPAAIDGVKVSLLDFEHEVRLRRALPDGVRLYTGDDFNYPALVKGDGVSASDALLGIFDPITPVASSALQALDRGDTNAYDEALAPTVPLARYIFGAPTYYYKTGVVFLAWLAGHQDAFSMVGGAQSSRSVGHLVETFKLADRAGLLPDPELAAGRMRRLLAVAGVEA